MLLGCGAPAWPVAKQPGGAGSTHQPLSSVSGRYTSSGGPATCSTCIRRAERRRPPSNASSTWLHRAHPRSTVRSDQIRASSCSISPWCRITRAIAEHTNLVVRKQPHREWQVVGLETGTLHIQLTSVVDQPATVSSLWMAVEVVPRCSGADGHSNPRHRAGPNRPLPRPTRPCPTAQSQIFHRKVGV